MKKKIVENYDEFVYRKRGRKYEKYGVVLPHEDYLQEGIWVVRIKPHSRSVTNGDYLAESYGEVVKAGEVRKVDLSLLGGLEEYADVVVGKFNDFYGKRMSNMDIARQIVKAIYDYNQQKEKENEKKTD